MLLSCKAALSRPGGLSERTRRHRIQEAGRDIEERINGRDSKTGIQELEIQENKTSNAGSVSGQFRKMKTGLRVWQSLGLEVSALVLRARQNFGFKLGFQIFPWSRPALRFQLQGFDIVSRAIQDFGYCGVGGL